MSDELRDPGDNVQVEHPLEVSLAWGVVRVEVVREDEQSYEEYRGDHPRHQVHKDIHREKHCEKEQPDVQLEVDTQQVEITEHLPVVQHAYQGEHYRWNEDDMDPLVGVVVVVPGITEVELAEVQFAVRNFDLLSLRHIIILL